MSKMSRLLRGELNKILMRPILYVITGVIVLALFFSVTLLSMENRGNKEYTVDGTSKTQLMANFNSNDTINKNISDKKVTDAFDKLAYYSELNSSPESTITAQLKNKISDCQNALNTYGLNIQELQRLEETRANASLLNNRKTLINYLNDLNDMIVNSGKSATPAILLSQTSYDNCLNLISDALFILNAEGTDLNLLETHLIIKQKIDKAVGYADITGPNYFDKILSVVNNDITNIVLSQELIENLTTQHTKTTTYMQNCYNQINTLYNDANATIEKLRTEMVKYFYYAEQFNQLVIDSIYLEPIKSFNDSKAHTFMSYEKVHIYEINERIAKNNYLITNNLTSNQFSSVFSPTMSSGDNVSALDLVYFGLEICSFIILIFCVVLAGGMIAGEQSNGTLKVLATRPFSRSKILTSKILATLIFGTIFMVFSALVLFIIGYAMYGLDTTPMLAVFNATNVFTISPFLMILIYLGLLIVKILFYVLLATTISTVFRSNVGAVAISIFIYFLTALFAVLFVNSGWYAFMPFAGIDFFKFFGGAFASTTTNPLSIALSSPMFFNSNLIIGGVMVLATTIIMLILSYTVFKKLEIK